MDVRVEEITLTDDEKWESIVYRDSTADGKFYYCVKTTGIYCKPSCSSRRPLRENILFVNDEVEAERLGFRTCKRCGAEIQAKAQRNAELVAEVCRHLENKTQQGKVFCLDEFLKKNGVSRPHFYRLFKSLTGTTPKSYESSARARKLIENLGKSKTVTDAIYSSGFGSNGRFYSDSDQIIGMTPTQYRKAGLDTIIRFALGKCFLGDILVAATERGICAITLGDDPEMLIKDFQDTFPMAHLIGADPDFEQMVSIVVGYVEDPSLSLDLPLDIRGTVFQTRVWEALRKIPSGKTATYADIAASLGCPNAVRAVARACASNKIAIAIPCHRVIRTDGSLSGYRWGVERKQLILDREKNNRPSEFMDAPIELSELF